VEGRMRLAPAGFVWRGDDGLSAKTRPGIGLGVGQSEMLKRLKEEDERKAAKTLMKATRRYEKDPWTTKPPPKPKSNANDDYLSKILVETEARRLVQENIAHHKNVGSYVGRRHAMGYPVRGQRTTSNARTAKKLNKIDRRG